MLNRCDCSEIKEIYLWSWSSGDSYLNGDKGNNKPECIKNQSTISCCLTEKKNSHLRCSNNSTETLGPSFKDKKNQRAHKSDSLVLKHPQSS